MILSVLNDVGSISSIIGACISLILAWIAYKNRHILFRRRKLANYKLSIPTIKSSLESSLEIIKKNLQKPNEIRTDILQAAEELYFHKKFYNIKMRKEIAELIKLVSDSILDSEIEKLKSLLAKSVVYCRYNDKVVKEEMSINENA